MMMTTAASTMPRYSCGETQGHGCPGAAPVSPPEFCGIWEGSFALTGFCVYVSDPWVVSDSWVCD